jgi:hypothetical protein
MSNLDPLGINVRLYNQISEILHELETNDHVTLKERVASLLVIGRIQVIFMGLRKEKINDTSAGSSVRKYATAFKAHDARGRKALAGKRAEPEPSGDDDIIGDAIGDAFDDERDSA